MGACTCLLPCMCVCERERERESCLRVLLGNCDTVFQNLVQATNTKQGRQGGPLQGGPLARGPLARDPLARGSLCGIPLGPRGLRSHGISRAGTFAGKRGSILLTAGLTYIRNVIPESYLPPEGEVLPIHRYFLSMCIRPNQHSHRACEFSGGNMEHEYPLR